MRRVRRDPSPNVEALARFRAEVMELFRKFEEDLVTVSKKHGFEINMWYSPSKIPQPNFKAGRLFLDVDQLYHDQDFQEFIGQHYPVGNMTRSNMEGENGAPSNSFDAATAELLKKNVELRRGRQDLSYHLGLLDFKQSNGDLRLRRSRPKRGDDR